MAFLTRCPCCRRPKRVDGEHSTTYGDPQAWCIGCGITFVAWTDSNGVSFALEEIFVGSYPMLGAA